MYIRAPSQRHFYSLLSQEKAVKLQVLLASILVTTCAHAQESSSETQSIRCSALTRILTIIDSPPEFNDAMAGSTQFYSGVFASFRKARTRAAITNGEISGRRDTVEIELRKTWQSRPEAVVQELALCNSWRAEFAPRLAALSGEIGSDKQLIEIVGSPPAKPKDGEVDKWRQIAKVGFTAWAASGSQTGGEAKADLRRQLIESMKK